MKKQSTWVAMLDQLVPVNGGWTSEYQFADGRKWRFDLAAIDPMIAIEIEGGSYSSGRHTRGTGFRGDMEKYNAAVLYGWRLLRYTPQQMQAAEFLHDVQQLLKARRS